MKSLPQWTKEYCGVTHLGELQDPVRCTVTRIGNGPRVTLYKFRRNPTHVEESDYGSFAAAKKAGEEWLKANLG